MLCHIFTDFFFFGNRKVRHWRRLKMKTRVFCGHFSNRLACVNSVLNCGIKLLIMIYTTDTVQ